METTKRLPEGAGTAATRAQSIQKALKLVSPTLLPKVMERLEIVPLRYRLNYIRAVLGESSRSNAIKAFCYECLGYEDVGNCTSPVCPLFQYRKV